MFVKSLKPYWPQEVKTMKKNYVFNLKKVLGAAFVVVLSVWWMSASALAWDPINGGDHQGEDWVLSDGMVISGTHSNIGLFRIPSGVTVTIKPERDGWSYGYLEIHANEIIIEQNAVINGTGAGYHGGAGGAGGRWGIEGSASQGGHGGGLGGHPSDGGSSAGMGGSDGAAGQFENKECGHFLCIGDDDGFYAGGGGAGAASGAGYATPGCGTTGSGLTGWGWWPPNGGSGGSGQTTGGAVYGQPDSARYIKRGPGGGGAGGSGGAWYWGEAGQAGGSGGAMIILDAKTSYQQQGKIYVNGADGGQGGWGIQSSDYEGECCPICFGYCNYYAPSGAGGGGGGGAGGSILISGRDITITSPDGNPIFFMNGGAGGEGGHSRASSSIAGDGGGGGAGRLMIYRHPDGQINCGGTIIDSSNPNGACPSSLYQAQGCTGASGTVWAEGVMIPIHLRAYNDVFDPNDPTNIWNGDRWPHIPIYLDNWPYIMDTAECTNSDDTCDGVTVYVVPYLTHKLSIAKYSYDSINYNRYEFMYWEHGGAMEQYISFDTPNTTITAHVEPDDPYIWNGHISDDWNTPQNWTYRNTIVCADASCSGGQSPPDCYNPSSCKAHGAPDLGRNVVIQDVYDANDRRMDDPGTVGDPEPFATGAPMWVRDDWDEDPGHCLGNDHRQGMRITQHLADCGWTETHGGSYTSLCSPISDHGYVTPGENGPYLCGHFHYFCLADNCPYGDHGDCPWSGNTFHGYNDTCGMLVRDPDYEYVLCSAKCTRPRCGYGSGESDNVTTLECKDENLTWICEGPCTGDPHPDSGNARKCTAQDLENLKASCSHIPAGYDQVPSQHHPCKWNSWFFSNDGCACGDEWDCNPSMLQTGHTIRYFHTSGNYFPKIDEDNAQARAMFVLPGACVMWADSASAKLTTFKDSIIYGLIGNVEIGDANGDGVATECVRKTTTFSNSPQFEIGGDLHVLGYQREETDPALYGYQEVNGGRAYFEGMDVRIGGGIEIDYCGQLLHEDLNNAITFIGSGDSDIRVAIAEAEANGGPTGGFNLRITNIVLNKDSDAAQFRVTASEFGRTSFMPNNYVKNFIVHRGTLNPNGHMIRIDRQLVVGSSDGGRVLLENPGSSLYVLGIESNAEKIVVQDNGEVNVSAGLLAVIPDQSAPQNSDRAFHLMGGKVDVNGQGMIVINNKAENAAWDFLMDGGELIMSGSASLQVDHNVIFTGGTFSGTGGLIQTGIDYDPNNDVPGGDFIADGSVVFSNFGTSPNAVTLSVNRYVYFLGGTYSATSGPVLELAGTVEPVWVIVKANGVVLDSFNVNKDVNIQYDMNDQNTQTSLAIINSMHVEEWAELHLHSVNLELRGNSNTTTPARLDVEGKIYFEGHTNGGIVTGPTASNMRYRMVIQGDPSDGHPAGVIGADNYIFENMSQYGIIIEEGANVDPNMAFTNSTFRNPDTNVYGATLLKIDSSEDIWLTSATFEAPAGIVPCIDLEPNNPAGCTVLVNIAKSVNSGTVNVTNESGSLTGEIYDNDNFDRVNWPARLPGISASLVNDTPLNSKLGHIHLDIDENYNPSTVEYLLQDTISGLYVQADGKLGSTPLWRTYSAWGGSAGIESYVADDTDFVFHAKARTRVVWNQHTSVYCDNDSVCYSGSPPACNAGETCTCQNHECLRQTVSYIPPAGTDWSAATANIHTPDRTPPDTPADLTAVVNTEPSLDKYVVVDWTDNQPGVEYYLYRMRDAAGAYPEPVNGIYDRFMGISVDTNKWTVGAGQWSVGLGLISQDSDSGDTALLINDPSVIDGDRNITNLMMRKVGGSGGVRIFFEWHNGKYVTWEIGVADGSDHKSRLVGIKDADDSEIDFNLVDNHWYSVKIVVRRDDAAGFLDDIEMWRLHRTARDVNGSGVTSVGIGTVDAKAQFDEFQVVTVYRNDAPVHDFDARDVAPPETVDFNENNLQALSTDTIRITWNNTPQDSGTDYYYYVVAVDEIGNESNLLDNEGFESRDTTGWTDGTGIPNTLTTADSQSGYFSSYFDFTSGGVSAAAARGQEIDDASVLSAGCSDGSNTIPCPAFHMSRWVSLHEYTSGGLFGSYMFFTFGDSTTAEAYSSMIRASYAQYLFAHAGFEVPAGKSVSSILASSYFVAYNGVPNYKAWLDTAKLYRMIKTNVTTGYEHVVVQWRLPADDPNDPASWHDLGTFTSAPADHSGLSPNTQRYYRLTACDYHGVCSAWVGNFGRYTLANVPPTPLVRWTPSYNEHALSVNVDDTFAANPPGTEMAVQECHDCSCDGTCGEYVINSGGLTQATEDWVAATYWEPTNLDTHVTYCYRAKARNGDGIETAFSDYVCKRPPGKVSITDLSVSKGVLPPIDDQPPVKVDGTDVQTVTMHLHDGNGYTDIQDVRIRVSVDGCLYQSGSCTWTDPRGYFIWDPTNGFREHPSIGGNEYVELLVAGTNCSSDCSEATGSGDELTLVFKYRVEANYGDVQNNSITAHVVDQDFQDSGDSYMLQDWPNNIFDVKFHVSALPPTPTNYTFDGVDPATVSWVNNPRPTFSAVGGLDPNQSSNFFDSGDTVFFRFRISSDPACGSDFDADRDPVEASLAGVQLFASYQPANDLPDGIYYWCTLAADHHDYAQPACSPPCTPNQWWFGSPSNPSQFMLDTSAPRIDAPIIACTDASCSEQIAPAPSWTTSPDIYFDWNDMYDVGSGPHSPHTLYYYRYGLDENDADPKYNTPAGSTTDTHYLWTSFPRGENVYFCVRGKDEAGNWSANAAGEDRPVCIVLNVEYDSVDAPVVRSDTHPDQAVVYCDTDLNGVQLEPNAHKPHICWDWVSNPGDTCDLTQNPPCISGVAGYSFLVSYGEAGTPDNTVESWANSCDHSTGVCQDSQLWVNPNTGESADYTFAYVGTYDPNTGSIQPPPSDRDIRYIMYGQQSHSPYNGVWYFCIKYSCVAGVESPKTCYRMNICSCSPKDDCVSTRMQMVKLPEGEIDLGGNTHTVPAFYIDRLEVTNAAYRECVKAGACPELDVTASLTRPDYYTNMKYADYPVVNVPWDAAAAYCTWKTKGLGRLPTEVEFAYASKYMYGKFFDGRDSYPNDQVKVGDTIRAESEYGPGAGKVLNLLNNVAEWTVDWSVPESYLTVAGITDQRECIAACKMQPEDVQDECKASCHQKSIRGVSFEDEQIRLQFRRSLEPDASDPSVGFRCVVPAAALSGSQQSSCPASDDSAKTGESKTPADIQGQVGMHSDEN